MTKTKLFSISFVIAFLSTALLCILLGYPLIFSPVSYKITDFFIFGILIGVLCFGLVFMNLSILTYLKKLLKVKTSSKVFYIVGTLLILQVLTLILGYIESDIYSKQNADPFYYYKGVGNSLVYVLTGNMTAIIIATLFATEQIGQQKSSLPKFDFDN